MMRYQHDEWWLIALSFVFALLLTVAPFPDWTLAWRPAWVALILSYWCVTLPDKVGIITAWAMGLLLDVLTGSLLGQHALGLCVVAYLAVKLHHRVRVYPMIQQSLFIGFLVLVHLVIMLFVKTTVGLPPRDWAYVAPALTSILLWPWLFILLGDIRRRKSPLYY